MRLRVQAKNLQLARAVMVEGVRVTELAEAQGIKHQRLSNTIRRIYDAHLAIAQLPDDWRSVTVTVPPDMAEQITAMAAEAAEAVHRDKQINDAMKFSHERISQPGQG